MLNNPTEGMFWQGDHIVPVAEGGGECDIQNYRTLCTPCHEEETKGLHQRLKKAKLHKSAAGTKDIRSLFSQKTVSHASKQEPTEHMTLTCSSSDEDVVVIL